MQLQKIDCEFHVMHFRKDVYTHYILTKSIREGANELFDEKNTLLYRILATKNQTLNMDLLLHILYV